MSLLVALMALVATPEAESARASTADLADPVVCRRSKLPEVGTRFKPKPVCQRKSDWAMFDKQNENELRQINNRGSNPGHSDAENSTTALSPRP